MIQGIDEWPINVNNFAIGRDHIDSKPQKFSFLKHRGKKQNQKQPPPQKKNVAVDFQCSLQVWGQSRNWTNLTNCRSVVQFIGISNVTSSSTIWIQIEFSDNLLFLSRHFVFWNLLLMRGHLLSIYSLYRLQISYIEITFYSKHGYSRVRQFLPKRKKTRGFFRLEETSFFRWNSEETQKWGEIMFSLLIHLRFLIFLSFMVQSY